MRLWDAESGAVLCEPLTGHGGSVTSVSLAVSPVTGRLVVASGCADNAVRLWDVESGDRCGDASVQVACQLTPRLRWTSRLRAQRLDAHGMVLSRSLDCGLMPHQDTLLHHFGMP